MDKQESRLTRDVVSETEGIREELEQYFDEHGNPARQAEGHYGLRRIYEDNLYILFILYMTLWNRDGDTRGNFELLWSYKQIFSSPSLRLEILNNIWLFIPLGAILFRLWPRWWFAAILLSVGIEVLQYIFGWGLAEFDDVISNGLGAAIGALMSKGCLKNGRTVGPVLPIFPLFVLIFIFHQVIFMI